MASQDLINAINSHLEAGESREKIKEYLMTEGWQEQAIDFAFEEIKPKTPSFWEQLPTYPYFVALDQKTAQLPPKVIWSISALLILFVIVIVFIVYINIDPFFLGGSDRDKERDTIYSQLQLALNRYHDQNNRYPQTLIELVPGFIKYVPNDPKTKRPYEYKMVGGGVSYALCIYFENKSSTDGCRNTDIINAQQLGIPIPSE